MSRFRGSLLAISLLIFLALPEAAAACVPADPRIPTPTPLPTDTPQEAARKQSQEITTAFGKADIVFRGQTTKTETFVSGRTFGTDIHSLRAFFAVDTVWKGSIGRQVTVYSLRTDISDCDLTNGTTGPPFPLRNQTTYLIYTQLNRTTQTYEISKVTGAAMVATDVAVIGSGSPTTAPAATTAPTTVAANVSPITTPVPQSLPRQSDGYGRSNRGPFLLIGGGVIGAALVGFLFFFLRRGRRSAS